ncbi:DMT family transporter [bacterium]|nr:DMT family transporter [bacterium]
MPLSRSNVAYIQLSLSMCMVGANIAVGKVIVETLPVFLFSSFRFLISLSILLVLLHQSKSSFSLSLKDTTALFIQSLFGVFLFSVFMLYGVQLTTANSAGIITSTIPACIAALSMVFLRERLSLKQMLSIGLAVFGIGILNLQGQFGDLRDGSLTGNMLILAAVISEAIFTITAKLSSAQITPLKMATGVNAFGLLLFSPLALRQAIIFDFATVPPLVWILVIYYSLTASILSFILWYRGISRVPASQAGLFTGFMPLSAVFVATFFLGEQLLWVHVLGMIAVLGAIILGTKIDDSKRIFEK